MQFEKKKHHDFVNIHQSKNFKCNRETYFHNDDSFIMPRLYSLCNYNSLSSHLYLFWSPFNLLSTNVRDNRFKIPEQMILFRNSYLQKIRFF